MTSIPLLDEATSNKSLKFAVDNNNINLLDWILAFGKPTNISECLIIARDKQLVDFIPILNQLESETVTSKAMKETVVSKVEEQVPPKAEEVVVPKIIEETVAPKAEEVVVPKIIEETVAPKAEEVVAPKAEEVVVPKVEEVVVPKAMEEVVVPKVMEVLKPRIMVLDKNDFQHSQLFQMILTDPRLVLQQLENGEISITEINYPGRHDWTPLMLVVNNYRYINRHFDRPNLAKDLLNKLIELGANVNAIQHNGSTALMYACRHAGTESSDEAVEILLNHSDINVNRSDADSMTALMYACEYFETSNVKTIELLLKHPKINLTAVHSKTRKDALMLLAMNFGFSRSFQIQQDSMQATRLFFAHGGFDTKFKNNSKDTTFDLMSRTAATIYKKEILILFIKKGDMTFELNIKKDDVDRVAKYFDLTRESIS